MTSKKKMSRIECMQQKTDCVCTLYVCSCFYMRNVKYPSAYSTTKLLAQQITNKSSGTLISRNDFLIQYFCSKTTNFFVPFGGRQERVTCMSTLLRNIKLNRKVFSQKPPFIIVHIWYLSTIQIPDSSLRMHYTILYENKLRNFPTQMTTSNTVCISLKY